MSCLLMYGGKERRQRLPGKIGGSPENTERQYPAGTETPLGSAATRIARLGELRGLGRAPSRLQFEVGDPAATYPTIELAQKVVRRRHGPEPLPP